MKVLSKVSSADGTDTVVIFGVCSYPNVWPSVFSRSSGKPIALKRNKIRLTEGTGTTRVDCLGWCRNSCSLLSSDSFPVFIDGNSSAAGSQICTNLRGCTISWFTDSLKWLEKVMTNTFCLSLGSFPFCLKHISAVLTQAPRRVSSMMPLSLYHCYH